LGSYKRHHYVPQWFQQRFFTNEANEKKFLYLDLKPEYKIAPNGKKYYRKALLNWGPPKCFYKDDLYTTRFPGWESTEIEEKFFGKIDFQGKKAVEYFANFDHPSIGQDEFYSFLEYTSVQKLRTPKGLEYLRSFAKSGDKNQLLFDMQKFQKMHCALWSECVWSIVDASDSNTKFLLSDNPITLYNQGCFPESKYCRGSNDPGIWLDGTYTIFPLDLNKALILTNLSWVRNPYGNSIKERPNAELFRGTVFNFTGIQIGRMLSEEEVLQINYVIKSRASRYIAAQKEEWLYPEKHINIKRWDELGKSYLFMPDPRSINFSSDVIIGYGNGKSDAFDEYGRKPWQADFKEKERKNKEWDSFQAFKGEYARIFGPIRRGLGFDFGSKDGSVDDAEYHAHHLSLEAKYKPKVKRGRKKRK
jgi:hypothetical protein